MNNSTKEHLEVNLSNSAEKLLLGIVEVCLQSDTPVISIISQPGGLRNSWTLIIESVNTEHSKEAADLFGVPLKELELFDFIIQLSEINYHVTPLAFKRAEYLKSNWLKQLWMRTTSVQALLAALTGILALVFGALAFIVNLLNSIRNLLQ